MDQCCDSIDQMSAAAHLQVKHKAKKKRKADKLSAAQVREQVPFM
jgi:hypothetical protein